MYSCHLYFMKTNHDFKCYVFISRECIYPRNCSVQFTLLNTLSIFQTNVVKEPSVILNGSKEARSRQDNFCKVVDMIEKSGIHFS